MLDKLIHKHLDAMEEIESEVEADVLKVYSAVNVDALLEDPEGEMLALAQGIAEMLEEKYFERIINQGIEFAKAVEEATKISVPDTTNPTLNAEE